jgi:hypothetical protein
VREDVLRVVLDRCDRSEDAGVGERDVEPAEPAPPVMNATLSASRTATSKSSNDLS